GHDQAGEPIASLVELDLRVLVGRARLGEGGPHSVLQRRVHRSSPTVTTSEQAFQSSVQRFLSGSAPRGNPRSSCIAWSLLLIMASCAKRNGGVHRKWIVCSGVRRRVRPA